MATRSRRGKGKLDADVLVVGAGLAGLTGAFDLAEGGRRVLLVDRAAAHGGTLTILDRQFPTDNCGFCQILPQRPGEAEACLKSILAHPEVTFSPCTTVEGVDGEAGSFAVRLLRRATRVDPARCTHCGLCIEACPEEYPDPMQGGVVTRKAIGYRAPVCTPSEIAVEPERCTLCGACVTACPEGAVDLEAQDEEEVRRVAAIVLATGFELYDAARHPEYGYGRFPDVITTLEFERLFGKALLEGREEIRRPSDGSSPSRIAWIQCVGSREEDRNYCSSVCCMISLKEARLCRELLPDAHLEIFYMDLRTSGKGYEAYLKQAESLGIHLTRGRPGEVLYRDGRVYLQVEGETADWREDPFDLVVLSVGFETSSETRRLAELLGISLDADGFLSPVTGSLSRTNRDGIYVAGAAAEPRDIPETVVQAHEAAAFAASQVGAPAPLRVVDEAKPEMDPLREDLRILLALCDCSGTLADNLDWETLRGRLEKDFLVAGALLESQLCKQDGLRALDEQIRSLGANALIVGACTPRWLNARLRETLTSAGVDPRLIQIVNLREQCAWAHGEARSEATARAEAQLRAALAACREYRRLPRSPAGSQDPGVLVLGGGPAGLMAALTLEGLGHGVTLVERKDQLGGNLRWLQYGLDPHFQLRRLLEHMLERVERAHEIRVLTGSTIHGLRGRPGHFRAELQGPDGKSESVPFGALVLATGAEINQPRSYRYGEDDRILTQKDLEAALGSRSLDPTRLREVAMIQCVESRDETHPYCSRVCCAGALKNALKLLEANPELRVIVFYRDLRAFGTLERFYRRAREAGVLFVPFEPQDPPGLDMHEGALTLSALDPTVGLRVRFRPDRLILNTAVVPQVPADLLSSIGHAPDSEGFLSGVNPKFRPLDLGDGVYGCGLALGPAFLGEAMAQGRGAALKAAGFLRRSERISDSQGATVLIARCSACGQCVEACPFQARELDEEEGHAVVHVEFCQACGTCTAACPNDASQLLGWTDRQVLSAIDALLEA